MNKPLPADILRPERHANIQGIVGRFRRVYGLAPRFWKVRPERVAGLPAEFGTGDDRQEAFAMIVGTALNRAIDREELIVSLGVANGTVARYALLYKKIPEERKAILRTLAGELASKARKQFLESDDGAGNTKN